MKAGRLRHRCTLHAQNTQSDGMGGLGHAGDNWQALTPFWAERSLPTGRTEVAAQQIQAQVTAEFIARPNAAFAVGRRVACADATYQIEAVLPDNRNTLVRLLCSSVPNP